MSKGALILAALKSRLETITVANGYGRTVKKVRGSKSAMDFDIPVSDCPLIEIVQDSANVEHGASSGIIVEYTMFILLIDKKDATDEQMEDFQQDVRFAIYGDSPTASGNSGITLGGNVIDCMWRSTKYDLNLVDANRRCLMEWTIRSKQVTFKI